MSHMRRLVPAIVAAALVAAVPAAARIIEIGQTADHPPTSCPGTTCRTITRTTGFVTRAGATHRPVTAAHTGRIVAVTLQLGNPNDKQIHFFNGQFGGTARFQVTVLHPGKNLLMTTVAQSEQYKLQPYFGHTVQIALRTSLPIKRGDIAAVTVPTWAPMLAVDLGGTSSWRAARGESTKCTDFSTQTAQTGLNQMARYRCLYSTARPIYSVTEISDPSPLPIVVTPTK